MNTFTSLSLSESDTLSGSILNSLQEACIQNQRVAIAEQKLALPFTPNDTLAYTQQEAYLRGQLDILQYLLDLSQESQKLVVSSQSQD